MIRLPCNPEDWRGLEGCHDPNKWYIKEEAMKVQRRCDPREVYEVLNESPTHYIIDRGCNDIALRKTDYEPVQEWSHLYTFYANPKGPIFELRSKEGPEGSIIIEGKVK